MIRTFFLWILRLLGLERRYQIAFVDEAPEALRKMTLYVIGGEHPWSVALDCPCGCGAAIHLSLLKHERPSWSLNVAKDGWPTLSPSVWRTTDCRSHFFLRKGVIVWCGPSDDLAD